MPGSGRSPGAAVGRDPSIGANAVLVGLQGGPEAVLQLKTLPTKKGRTNPSLTGPKTLLNETI